MKSVSISLFCVGLLAGCGGVSPSDPDAGNCQIGINEGQCVKDYSFSAKAPTGVTDTRKYSELKLETLKLSDITKDPSVKYILLSGVADWCAACQDEQKDEIPALQEKYGPKGLRIVEVHAQDSSYMPSTEDNLNRWGEFYGLHVIMALDSSKDLWDFNGGSYSTFPVNGIIQASDRKIIWKRLAKQDLDAVVGALLK